MIRRDQQSLNQPSLNLSSAAVERSGNPILKLIGTTEPRTPQDANALRRVRSGVIAVCDCVRSSGSVSRKSVMPQGPPIIESGDRVVPVVATVSSSCHRRSSAASVAAIRARWPCRWRSNCRRSTRSDGWRASTASSWRTAISMTRGGKRPKGSPGDKRHEDSTRAKCRSRPRAVGCAFSSRVRASIGMGTERTAGSIAATRGATFGEGAGSGAFGVAASTVTVQRLGHFSRPASQRDHQGLRRPVEGRRAAWGARRADFMRIAALFSSGVSPAFPLHRPGLKTQPHAAGRTCRAAGASLKRPGNGPLAKCEATHWNTAC